MHRWKRQDIGSKVALPLGSCGIDTHEVCYTYVTKCVEAISYKIISSPGLEYYN